MINNYLINSGTVVNNSSSGLKSEFCYIGIPFIPKFNMRSSPNMAVITYTFFFFLMPTFIRNLHYMKNPLALMEYMFDKNKFCKNKFPRKVVNACANTEGILIRARRRARLGATSVLQK